MKEYNLFKSKEIGSFLVVSKTKGASFFCRKFIKNGNEYSKSFVVEADNWQEFKNNRMVGEYIGSSDNLRQVLSLI